MPNLAPPFARPESLVREGEVITSIDGVPTLGVSDIRALLDQGIATAAQLGVYTPDGKWLIEGHGAEPDIIVDDLPHATFSGGDAQLQAAIQLLQKQIRVDPRPVPPHPPYPDKSFQYQK